MRCKPGDLAIVVGTSKHQNFNGTVVVVERRVVPGEVLDLDGNLVRVRRDRHADWIIRAASGAKLPFRVDTPLPDVWHVRFRPLGDRFLRPLRDSEGPDETLQWAPVPKERSHA